MFFSPVKKNVLWIYCEHDIMQCIETYFLYSILYFIILWLQIIVSKTREFLLLNNFNKLCQTTAPTSTKAPRYPRSQLSMLCCSLLRSYQIPERGTPHILWATPWLNGPWSQWMSCNSCWIAGQTSPTRNGSHHMVDVVEAF